MPLHESAEMYLETIYVLSSSRSHVRSIDIAEHMGYSKPSVSRAIGLLKQGGYILVDENGYIKLTELGEEISLRVFERHTVLSGLLVSLGVDDKVASQEACRIEHVVSDETFEAIRNHLLQQK